MNPTILSKDDLHRESHTYELQAVLYGDMRISLILVDMPPGQGTLLHLHPYEEVFIVLEGRAAFTVGSRAMEIQAGQIVIVPANTSHKFVNSGEGQLKQIDIHVNRHFITQWLEG